MRLPPGYVSRSASLADLDAIVRLFKDCDLVDVGFEDPTREFLEEDWRRASFDADRDTVLVSTQAGEPAAFAIFSGANPSLSLDFFVRVHPDHRGRGIGSALLSRAEAWARERTDTTAETKLRTSLPSTDAAARELLLGSGYRHVRTFWQMERELTSPVRSAEVPEGVELRAYRHPADSRPLYDALEEAFRDHWENEPYPWADHDAELARADPELVTVAIADGEMVGGLIADVVEGTGWIGVLGVRRAWRGRGIATALLDRSFERLAGRGFDRAMLNVDSDNLTGATRLYESVGMSPYRAWDWYEKPVHSGPDSASSRGAVGPRDSSRMRGVAGN